MTALMISTISIRSPQQMKAYLEASKELAGTFGAELVAQGETRRVLNGPDVDHTRVVIARFPSLEALNTWYDSDAYAKIAPLREEAADMHMIAYEE